MDKYKDFSDDELIMMLRNGDESVMDYIMDKYKKTVRNKAKALYLMGGDEDDLIQEGMIGLFKAVVDYKPERDASFYTFANLCISRQMYTAIESSRRKKHQPLNFYVSFYEGEAEGEHSSLDESDLSSEEANPESLFIAKENDLQIRENIARILSPMENEVMNYFMDGLDYKEIAVKMGRTPKSVDNAIQRIKNKIIKSKIKIV